MLRKILLSGALQMKVRLPTHELLWGDETFLAEADFRRCRVTRASRMGIETREQVVPSRNARLDRRSRRARVCSP